MTDLPPGLSPEDPQFIPTLNDRLRRLNSATRSRSDEWEDGPDVPGPVDPDQPVNFTVAVETTGALEGGQPQAMVRVVMISRPSGTRLFTVWTYRGGESPPADASRWESHGRNFPISAAGTTTMDFWVDQESEAYPLQVTVTAAGQGHVTPGVGNVVKVVTIPAAGAVPQPTINSITVVVSNARGVPTGQFRIVFTPPSADEYWLVNWERIRYTDATYTTIWPDGEHGEWTHFGSTTQSPWLQPTGWPLPSEAEYWRFRARSVTKGHIANDTDMPTFQVTVPASTGLKLSDIDPSTIVNSEFVIDPVTNRFTFGNLPLSKATGFNTDQFKLVGSVFTIDSIDAQILKTGVLWIGNGNVAKVGVFSGPTPGAGNYIVWMGKEDYLLAPVGYHNIGATSLTVGTFVPGSVLHDGTNLLIAGNYYKTVGNATVNGSGFAAITITPALKTAFHEGVHTGTIYIFEGFWAKRAGIGGTSIYDAKIVADSNGNVAINGATFLLTGTDSLTGGVTTTRLNLAVDPVFGLRQVFSASTTAGDQNSIVMTVYGFYCQANLPATGTFACAQFAVSGQYAGSANGTYAAVNGYLTLITVGKNASGSQVTTGSVAINTSRGVVICVANELTGVQINRIDIDPIAGGVLMNGAKVLGVRQSAIPNVAYGMGPFPPDSFSTGDRAVLDALIARMNTWLATARTHGFIST